MMLQINIPRHCHTESAWICSVLIQNHLGLKCQLEVTEDKAFTLRHANHRLTLPDIFFCSTLNIWLSLATLPRLPLAQWEVASSGLNAPLVKTTIPVLFGEPGFHLDESGNGHLNLDVFGSAFFMLSRYEEAVSTIRDQHDRFPATASIAYKAGFLDRPIIDEYVEILWAAMQQVWPGLERKPRQPRIHVSCDVDSPYAFNGQLKGMVRCLAGDLLKRRSLTLARQNLVGHWNARRGDHARDPHRSAIDWIMDVNERAGNQVAFYFIPENTDPALDTALSLDEPRMRALLRHIHARGHEIGIHPGYNTYQHPENFARSVTTLRRVMDKEGIRQEILGGRQHILRWATPTTARLWAENGLTYDSSLSYADRPGFRCGTSREYPLYDVGERRPLPLRERPLIVMECSVIAERYLGLGYTPEALELMLTLKARALRYGGDFTLLWHNSHLTTAKDREFYQALVA